MAPEDASPRSILIIGTGVFGLTTLLELLSRKRYKDTHITVISPSIPEHLTSTNSLSNLSGDALAPRIASNDINRIIRVDYADPAYASLMSVARSRWLQTPGLSQNYHESGLLLTAETDTPAADYLMKSLSNTTSLNHQVQQFRNRVEVAGAVDPSSLARVTGAFGYLNEQSGWANAGGSLEWLWQRISLESKSRNIKFVRSPVEELIFPPDRRKVLGATVAGGKTVSADLTILATGAWTPALLQLSGIASSRGQCLIYVDVSDEEAGRLKNVPAHFNLSKGCVFFPPTKKPDGGWQIKVAQHTFGYSNPQQARNATSLPAFPERLPAADHDTMVAFLNVCLPSVDISSREIRTRMCWYLDTASSDFLVCYHPQFGGSLFVASGGSGHAFKFLPVLGEHIVDVLDGADQQNREGFWTKKWQWPTEQKDATGGVVPEIWCRDGSRAGVPGVSLEHALAGDRRTAEMVRSRL